MFTDSSKIIWHHSYTRMVVGLWAFGRWTRTFGSEQGGDFDPTWLRWDGKRAGKLQYADVESCEPQCHSTSWHTQTQTLSCSWCQFLAQRQTNVSATFWEDLGSDFKHFPHIITSKYASLFMFSINIFFSIYWITRFVTLQKHHCSITA